MVCVEGVIIFCDHISECEQRVRSGVPQGTGLRPLLFMMDIKLVPSEGNVITCTDDTEMLYIRMDWCAFYANINCLNRFAIGTKQDSDPIGT